MLISELTVYDFLREKIKLPDADAKRYAKEMALVEEKLHQEINTKVADVFEKEKNLLATKSDLKESMAEVKESILKLEIKMAAGFKDNIKWIVGIFLVAISLAVAILKAF